MGRCKTNARLEADKNGCRRRQDNFSQTKSEISGKKRIGGRNNSSNQKGAIAR
ncbi:MAG: hypothetical protein KBB16_02295 [Candidatus Pacebacteria bacterium]|nr:hypothetical protein [Candidatus Paceibacterota bacterium]